MKTFRILFSLLTLALGPAFTGCASMGASSTEPLLSAAGFRVKTPETATQKEIYATLPPYKLQRGTHQGKTFLCLQGREARDRLRRR